MVKNYTTDPIEAIPEEPIVQFSHEDSIDNSAALELLARWRAEDATDDPKEIEAAERDLLEFKRGMNAAGGRIIFPDIE